VTCFVVSVASSIQSASNPAWVPLAAVSGLSAGRFLCWLPDRNYVNVRTYLGTECCGLPPDAFPRY
ncbi:MAG: hypothetical protein JSS09_08410, partial [Verrucomicrobia bacterium]|nr:hypothetical protein [Verrucomicrobiota bacterium]